MEHLTGRQKYLLNSLKKDSELNYLNVYERMLIHQEISSHFSKKSGKREKRYTIPKKIEDKINMIEYETLPCEKK